MGPHFMLLLSIYVLYPNVTYIYPVSCLVEIKLFQIVPNCFNCSQVVSYIILFILLDCFAVETSNVSINVIDNCLRLFRYQKMFYIYNSLE